MDSLWFENWFNTSYYHLLYSNRNDDEAQRFIDHILQFVDLPQGSTVLDVACGKGRHSKYLSSKGFNVTGIDLSTESIKDAMQHQNEHLTFLVHDMREGFKVNQYDMAVNMFTSFGYFESHAENEKAIATIAKAVIPNGLVVIDFFNSYLVNQQVMVQTDTTIEGINFKTSKKIENGFVLKNIRVTDQGKVFDYQEKVQLLSLLDFEDYLSKENLNIKNIFGNYDLEPFNLESSPRLIILAQKSAV